MSNTTDQTNARRSKFKDAGLCMTCGSCDISMLNKRYCEKHRVLRANAVKRTIRRLKLEVLNAYGGPQCACLKCPERSSNLAFLSIDHIGGGGTKHRKSIGGGSSDMYYWLKKNNFPSGYRVLCHTCNQGRQINGGECPHTHP